MWLNLLTILHTFFCPCDLGKHLMISLYGGCLASHFLTFNEIVTERIVYFPIFVRGEGKGGSLCLCFSDFIFLISIIIHLITIMIIDIIIINIFNFILITFIVILSSLLLFPFILYLIFISFRWATNMAKIKWHYH